LTKPEVVETKPKLNEPVKKVELFNVEDCIKSYNYYNEHIVDFCLGKANNFLEKPFQSLNHIEIDLNDTNFFSEKLEVM
jgi:hypothetical protein